MKKVNMLMFVSLTAMLSMVAPTYSRTPTLEPSLSAILRDDESDNFEIRQGEYLKGIKNVHITIIIGNKARSLISTDPDMIKFKIVNAIKLINVEIIDKPTRKDDESNADFTDRQRVYIDSTDIKFHIIPIYDTDKVVRRVSLELYCEEFATLDRDKSMIIVKTWESTGLNTNIFSDRSILKFIEEKMNQFVSDYKVANKK